MLTQFETDMITRTVHALEAIADELRMIRELKTQEAADNAAKEADSKSV